MGSFRWGRVNCQVSLVRERWVVVVTIVGAEVKLKWRRQGWRCGTRGRLSCQKKWVELLAEEVGRGLVGIKMGYEEKEWVGDVHMEDGKATWWWEQALWKETCMGRRRLGRWGGELVKCNCKIQCSYCWVVGYLSRISAAILLVCVWPLVMDEEDKKVDLGRGMASNQKLQQAIAGRVWRFDEACAYSTRRWGGKFMCFFNITSTGIRCHIRRRTLNGRYLQAQKK